MAEELTRDERDQRVMEFGDELAKAAFALMAAAQCGQIPDEARRLREALDKWHSLPRYPAEDHRVRWYTPCGW